MSNIVPSTDFQTRLFEKIRSDIGTLMTDEELKKLVEQAIDKAFFEEVKERDRYDSVIGRKPPHLVTMVRDLLKDRVDVAIKEWIKENEERVRAAIDSALTTGLATAIIRAFDQKFSNAFFQLQESIRTGLDQIIKR